MGWATYWAIVSKAHFVICTSVKEELSQCVLTLVGKTFMVLHFYKGSALFFNIFDIYFFKYNKSAFLGCKQQHCNV
jgi:uncharacterized membrane-anchored protein